jgi:hypothetical protein
MQRHGALESLNLVEWVNDLYGPSDPPSRANSKVLTTITPIGSYTQENTIGMTRGEYSEEILSFVAV